MPAKFLAFVNVNKWQRSLFFRHLATNSMFFFSVEEYRRRKKEVKMRKPLKHQWKKRT
jgi:hypothetical protein